MTKLNVARKIIQLQKGLARLPKPENMEANALAERYTLDRLNEILAGLQTRAETPASEHPDYVQGAGKHPDVISHAKAPAPMQEIIEITRERYEGTVPTIGYAKAPHLDEEGDKHGGFPGKPDERRLRVYEPATEDLCEDEGCPEHGTPHVCRNLVQNPTLDTSEGWVPCARWIDDKGEEHVAAFVNGEITLPANAVAVRTEMQRIGSSLVEKVLEMGRRIREHPADTLIMPADTHEAIKQAMRPRSPYLASLIRNAGPAFKRRLNRYKTINGKLHQLHATRGWKVA